jgi:O-6-methylguanine DNA methyltransferase
VTEAEEVIHAGTVETPLGTMRIACNEWALVALALPGEEEAHFVDALARPRPATTVVGTNAMVAEVAAELRAYFAGDLRAFSTPLAPEGTAFQQRVWSALCAVPYGETRTYGVLAAQLGRPRAARAVGHANGANPLPIVVPCHRLVGHDGGLVRYGRYGGGLAMKRWLIEHERRHALRLDRTNVLEED